MKPLEPASVPEEDTAGNQVGAEIEDGCAHSSADSLPLQSDLPNGYVDTEDSDTELEDAFSATGTLVDREEDEAPEEDWESEINPPCFVVPHNSYLYGKDVFVPSDIHPVSTRQKTPFFCPEEGQFDDAEEDT